MGIDDILDHSPLEHNTNRDSDTLYRPYVDQNLRFPGLDHFSGFQDVFEKKNWHWIKSLLKGSIENQLTEFVNGEITNLFQISRKESAHISDGIMCRFPFR